MITTNRAMAYTANNKQDKRDSFYLFIRRLFFLYILPLSFSFTYFWERLRGFRGSFTVIPFALQYIRRMDAMRPFLWLCLTLALYGVSCPATVYYGLTWRNLPWEVVDCTWSMAGVPMIFVIVHLRKWSPGAGAYVEPTHPSPCSRGQFCS